MTDDRFHNSPGGLWQWGAAFVVLAGVLMFHELGGVRTLGSHEGFAVVPAQEMLASGDWIVPRFGGLPRLEKPPLAYWVVATSASVCGELTEWSARLPAALSAVALAVLMGVWAARWYGTTAGFGAAIVQISCVYVLIYGRKAEVDMLLCLLTTAAMFLVAQHNSEESRRRAFVRWVGVYALLAVSWLAKFHYGPAMVLIPCVVYFAVERRWRAFWQFANPVGLALMAAAVFIWPYLVLRQVPNAMDVWRGETLGRAVGELSSQPVWFYLPALLWLPLPWTPLVAAAVPASWRRAWKQSDSRERFLWIWMLTQLVIVTASANKHKNYVMAALPAFSLLAAQSWTVFAERMRTGEAWWNARRCLAFGASCVVAGIAGAVVVVQTWPDLALPAIAACATVGLGGPAAVWLLARRRVTAAAWTALAVCLACYANVNTWIIPARDHRLPAAQFAREVRRHVGAETPVCAYRMGRTPTLFYLDGRFARAEELNDLQDSIQHVRKMYVLAQSRHLDELEQVGQCQKLRSLQREPRASLSSGHPLVLVELFPGQARPRVASPAEDKRQ